MKSAFNLGLFIASLLPSGLFAAQQQTVTEPVNQTQQEVSRPATTHPVTEQKNQAHRVWDNDNIPKEGNSLSVVGQPPPANAKISGHGTVQSDKDVNKGPSATEKKTLEEDLLKARDQLRSLEDDLTALQRKYVVDHQAYYTKPNYIGDTDGAASLKDEQAQMSAKQQKIAEQQKQIEQLQEALKSSTAGDAESTKQ